MRASDDLPTAVDFTNHLVNYIEVSADEVQRPRRESDRTNRSAIPPGVHPPQVLPEIIGTGPAGDAVEDEAEKEEPEEEIPPGDFRNIVPQFLADIDQEEDNDAYQQAANVISDSSAPPVLPLFLGKSILNGTTPMKDDNSVLNYPNHTVLNHLATSSIKNGVLATSVTTRYKRKVRTPMNFHVMIFAYALLAVRNDDIVQTYRRYHGSVMRNERHVAQNITFFSDVIVPSISSPFILFLFHFNRFSRH